MERRPTSPDATGIIKATVTSTGLLPAATGAGGVSSSSGGGVHGGKAVAPTITFSTKGMVHGAGETLRCVCVLVECHAGEASSIIRSLASDP